MTDIEEILDGEDIRYKKYIPERDYIANDYKPFKAPFSSLCQNCDVYHAMLRTKGLVGDTFPIKCKRHVLKEFSELIPSDFPSEEEYYEFMINADPVAWARAKFNWEAYWYQEEMMSCTGQKKVIRAGRRTGKTATIVMLTLWGIFTHKDWTVLVIAPYQSQVTKIFDEMEKLLNLNPELSKSIKRKTKNPQRLELVNGSKVLGFSSGSKSASKSDKVRGQDANYIVIDEADYLDDQDLEAILAILASHPDCGLWASSTPTGRHAKFYQWCTDKNLGFKEFWYISQESNRWTPEAEHFFRSNYNATTFEHEFLAEFGLQEGGIFRNDLIDGCLSDYKLPRERQSHQSRVVMGVDWNGEKNGVHIVVTEYWNGKYSLLDKSIVRNDEFTQHAAIDRIIELDNKYGCDFIYVDEGYGRVQVEMLHKMGMKNPGGGLHKRVVAYAFNKPIELRDPRTGLLIKKPSKPFLVNITALQLEEGRLSLPLSEDTQILVQSKDSEIGNKTPGLVQQMRNFAIERISVLGLPTYTQGDDHTLFAFMLSIVGFIMQFSDLKQANHAVGGAFVATRDQASANAESNERLSQVVRQLDAGMSKSSLGGDISSVFTAKHYGSNLRKSIARGDKNTIRKYFGSQNILRGRSLDKNDPTKRAEI